MWNDDLYGGIFGAFSSLSVCFLSVVTYRVLVLFQLLGLAAEFQQVNCEEHFNQSLYHVFDRRSGDRPKHRHE